MFTGILETYNHMRIHLLVQKLKYKKTRTEAIKIKNYQKKIMEKY